MQTSALRTEAHSANRFSRLPGLLVLLACLTLASGCTALTATGRNAEGVRLFQQGQYQQALQEFQEATYDDPGNADGYYNLGATYHRLGRLQNRPEQLAQAETCYRQCLERNPNHRDCHRGMAVLLIEENRRDEAFRSIQSWAEQQPALAEPRVELARLYEEAGDRQAAMERLTEAIARDPNNPRAWAALGKLREAAGEQSQALANYQRALQIEPVQPQITARVAALQNVLAQPQPTPAIPSSIPALPGNQGPVMAGQPPATNMR